MLNACLISEDLQMARGFPKTESFRQSEYMEAPTSLVFGELNARPRYYKGRGQLKK